MDIQNATAAGPPRGLLDVIFGSGPGPEEADADGKGFGSLMNLIRGLNMRQEAEEGRTPGETMLGKNIADGGVVGKPGSPAVLSLADGSIASSQDADQRERLERLAALGVPAAMLAQVPAQPPAGLATLRPEQVNAVLQAKGLPALSPQEMKLLREVNGKLAQANGQGAEVPPELAVGGVLLDPKALPKAANAGQPMDPTLQKAMAGKGLDPRRVKVLEEASVAGTPDKLVTTDTYLKMHENANAAGANAMAKPQANEPAGKAPQPGAADSSAAAKQDATITATAVASTAQKGPGLGSRKGDEGSDLPGGAKQGKVDASAAAGFGGALALKSEATKHDVYLPASDKPEQRANMLLAEIGSGVALHAHKGGGEMRLVLHPDDLGEVKVKIGTKNGKVEVQISAENEDVAKMIRGGSKELEASLKDQNLSLAKFEVSVGDTGSVVSTDTRSSLGDQFLSQNQQPPQHHGGGFAQGGMSDEGRGAHWGSEQGGRQGGSYAPFGEEPGRSAARGAPSVPKNSARAFGGSRRLDVVA